MLERAKKVLDGLIKLSAENISRRYNVEAIEYRGLDISHTSIPPNWVKISGPRVKYITNDLKLAKIVRDLHHVSGFKYSRILPNRETYIIDCRTTDQITIKDLNRLGEKGYILTRILILIYLRSLKRLKMLLKNTKF